MATTSNIDLLLTLSGHGWSMAYITDNSGVFDCQITHVFNDPYSDAIDALLLISKGYNSSFFWFDEPFGIKIELKLESSDMVMFTIYEIEEEFYQEIGEDDLTLVKSFEVSLRQLLIMFYYQLKKTCVLLEDKEYAKNRSHDFPVHKFRELETTMKKYYGIKS